MVWFSNSCLQTLQNIHYYYYIIIHRRLYSMTDVWPPFSGFPDHTIRHTVGLLSTSDQPVAETSTYTGQHNIQTQQTSMPRAGFEPATPADLRLAATGISSKVFITCQSNIGKVTCPNVIWNITTILILHKLVVHSKCVFEWSRVRTTSWNGLSDNFCGCFASQDTSLPLTARS
jgi:hypothetical protein